MRRTVKNSKKDDVEPTSTKESTPSDQYYCTANMLISSSYKKMVIDKILEKRNRQNEAHKKAPNCRCCSRPQVSTSPSESQKKKKASEDIKIEGKQLG